MQIQVVKLVAPSNTLSLSQLEQLLGERSKKIRQFIVEQGPVKDTETVTIEFRGVTRVAADQMIKEILGVAGVREVLAPH